MGITGTQNLHYPDATDFVEDHSTNIEVLARQLDARMHSHNLDALRFGDGRPFCVLDVTAPVTFNWNSGDPLTAQLQFDTVRVDTDNMANLDVLPQAMTLNTAGYYEVGFYATVPTMGCVAGTGSLLWAANNHLGSYSTVSTFGTAHSQVTDAGNGWVPGGGSLLALAAAGDTWGWVSAAPAFGTNCPAIMTCTFARLWAYKARDTP